MENYMKVIVFTLKGQRFGVDVQQVISIEKIQEITKVPRTSEFIKGVINLRGETIPIVDLKERLEIEQTESSPNNRFLIVQVEDVQVGLIVDSATDVLDINTDAIQPAPKMIGGVQEVFLQGVAKLESELLIMLDLGRVLDLEQTNEIKEIIE
ncbi:chemotaxis protein CheW [Ornithinibacillus sp. L9]|uniref:Chemotaxis protein CheW n=1 Tax=Ornithinibacillus caprae TaxID=2678566 RepID=A0A6N8FHI2_9BACI|nr:chemotaxis protein CheW [Ornithinibacillus caprae]MUK89040.1 chemotaxis protein CheW [Ornithinibacillus caprae]